MSRVRPHRSQFVYREKLAVPANSGLSEDTARACIDSDEDYQNDQRQSKDKQTDDGRTHVETPLQYRLA
jgi:hypothetical protein